MNINNLNIDKIIEVFVESGIMLTYEGEDIPIAEYIEDSIQFMTLLVQLEDKFLIEFPDDFLQIDYFASLYALSNIIDELQQKKSECKDRIETKQ